MMRVTRIVAPDAMIADTSTNRTVWTFTRDPDSRRAAELGTLASRPATVELGAAGLHSAGGG